MFQKETSAEALASFTCASCAEECLNKDCRNVGLNDIDLNLLRRPDVRTKGSLIVDPEWLDSYCSPPTFVDNDGLLQDVLVDSSGISTNYSGQTILKICKSCLSSLKCKKVPPLALANHMYISWACS
jgi:hypothetical protein